jgi:hypothetical protein
MACRSQERRWNLPRTCTGFDVDCITNIHLISSSDIYTRCQPQYWDLREPNMTLWFWLRKNTGSRIIQAKVLVFDAAFGVGTGC